jgi:hypothetical protein
MATITTPSGGMSIGGAVTGGTSGSVPYVNSGVSLAQDNANLFYDASNNRLGVKQGTPTSSLHSGGSFATTIVSKSTTYTATESDNVIFCDTTSAGFTVNLPTAVGITGRWYWIIKTDSGGNTVTIDGNASETIDGSTTRTIQIQYHGYLIVSDGANWKSLASHRIAIGTPVDNGTAKSIPFIDTAVTISQNASNFVWDNSAVGMGIQTATVRQPLTVGPMSSAYTGANAGIAGFKLTGQGLIVEHPTAANDSAFQIFWYGTQSAFVLSTAFISTGAGHPISITPNNNQDVWLQSFGTGNVAVGNTGGTATKNLLDVNGATGTAILTKTSTYTATITDSTILCDATTGSMTINLPAVSGVTRRQYVIKKIDSSVNTVTIDPNASETIDGATTYVLSAQWASAHIQTNGTAWYVLAKN